MDLVEFLRARLAEMRRGSPGPGPIGLDIDAKLRIVDRYALVLQSFEDRQTWPDVSRREKSHAYATLRDLAAPFVGHPDYDPEWTRPPSVARLTDPDSTSGDGSGGGYVGGGGSNGG